MLAGDDCPSGQQEQDCRDGRYNVGEDALAHTSILGLIRTALGNGQGGPDRSPRRRLLQRVRKGRYNDVRTMSASSDCRA
jgi:hypothetical protein